VMSLWSVCLSAYISQNYMSKLHEIFCRPTSTCCRVVVARPSSDDVMYFRLCGRRHVFHIMGQMQIKSCSLRSSELLTAKLRIRGQSLLSLIALLKFVLFSLVVSISFYLVKLIFSYICSCSYLFIDRPLNVFIRPNQCNSSYHQLR